MKDVKCKYCGKVLKEDEQYEHDGSIEDGFEMVTHPISLDYRNIPNRREQAICRKIQVLRCHLEYQEDIPDSKVPLC